MNYEQAESAHRKSELRYITPQLVMIDKHARTSKALCQAPMFFARFARGRLNVLHSCAYEMKITVIT